MYVSRAAWSIFISLKPGCDERWPALSCRDREPFRIPYIYQIQSMGRCRYACNSPISGLKYLTNPGRPLLPCTHRHQCTGDIANHMMQERICLHIYYDEVPFSGYLDGFKKPNG